MRTAIAIMVVTVFALALSPGLAFAEESSKAPTMDGLTGGEFPWEQRYDEALLEGRSAYNSEDWEEAREAFTQAIQILPERAAAYRNLGRVYNFMGAYPEATEYYDQYLRLAPNADDRELIRQERRGTAMRVGDEPWRPPADQRMSLRALERELAEGRGLSQGGGGAWGLYQTLLRRNFASPEVEDLRRKLAQKLADEFEDRLEPQGEFLPHLSSDDWNLQEERLDALYELARSEKRLHMVERRRLVVEALQAFYGGEYDRSADLAAQAAQENKDLPFVGWYRVAALEKGNRPVEALSVVEELIDSGVFRGEGLRRVEVLRGQLLQQLGEYDEATRVFYEVLER